MSDVEREDDTFDDEKDESDVIGKEYSKVKDLLEIEGYREGLEHGHGTSIQHGFNTGYKFSANKLYQVGKLKGRINAILSLNFSKPESLAEKKKLELEELLTSISQHEENLFKQFKEHTTAKLIAEEVQESVTITDQTSSLYVEDDYSDFLGLRSETSDSDAKDLTECDTSKADDKNEDALKIETCIDDFSAYAFENKSKKTKEFDALSDEVDNEITMFKSKLNQVIT